MGLEDDLYSELTDLRQELREKYTYSNGKVPNICSDEALREISQRIPTKLEDFSAIVSIGQKFAEHYGEDFVAITRKYAMTVVKGTCMDPEVARTLRDLQKKLVNISKNNRLLFQAKLTRTTFDLASLSNFNFTSVLFGRKQSIILCDSTKGAENLSTYRRVNEIMREVNRALRDKGQNDLFIGYPFVEGKMPGEDFDIRAPLALFPITLEKNSNIIKISMDYSRDVVYNNSLIIAFMKFGKKNRPLPDNVIEEYTAENFITNLIEFYNEQGISIESSRGSLKPFTEYKTGEFPKYNSGELCMVQNMVLGKYPTYSNYIQKDFDEILASGDINEILSNLIRNLNDGNFYTELPYPLTESEIKNKGAEASEKKITYINSLNSAQENVLTFIDKGDELVVQGPPGTGKSQVITGLITSAVAKNKTVLMVSEKKTALDVVYSRLGNLSKYCLMIDDVGNKEQFYQQLGRMLESEYPKTGTDLTELSESIDNDVAILTNIADTVYSPGEFGIEPYKLYSMDKWINPNHKEDFEKYKTLKNEIGSVLLEIEYLDLKELHRKFGAIHLLRNFKEYCEIVDISPWIVFMKQDLSEYQIGEIKANILDLENQMKDWKTKGFMSRLFSKGKVQREATTMLDKYFDSYSERTVRMVLDSPRTMFNDLDRYDMFTSRATIYNKLTENERIYGHNLISLSDNRKDSFPEANDQIYKYVLNYHLQKFDSSNKAVLQEIQDFDSIIQDMDRKINEKKEITKNKVEEIFQHNLRYITESKRRGDIARIVENKRKWTLNKFINRYSYELFKGVKVWLLTPEVVSEIMPLDMGLFDLLIFDEASQMYVERGIPSIYRARKVVIAGDHKQLRPSSLGAGRVEYLEEEEEDYEYESNSILEEESLLDLARARYDNILLNFHYRSKYEELIAFSNYAFYHGKLYVSPNITQPLRPPIEVHNVDGLWENMSNRIEAEQIVELLKDFFNTREEDETVGIISFNVSQRDLINDCIDEECLKNPSFAKSISAEMTRFDNGEDVGLFIKNIESVQGDERDVIMFSVGYAKNAEGKMMQRFGWLNNVGGENRLNVAISRAKKKIHIVTSFEAEDLNVDASKNDGPKILKKYLQYAKAISNENKELARSILESFGNRWECTKIVDNEVSIIDRVHDELIAKGYNLERNVGIGGYQIALAVMQNGQYLLGIECDSHIYEMSESTRERDYHRQKYLESRGWYIHRVWTPGMWKNSENEINNIIKAIERVQKLKSGGKKKKVSILRHK